MRELGILRRSPLFLALDDVELRALVRRCRRVEMHAGDQIFTAGRPATTFYLLLAGRVKIYKLSARGDEQVLHHYGAGVTFGEAAVLGGGSYPAFAEVLEESVLLAVERATLLELIGHKPELALAMLGGLAVKLHEFARLIEQLSLKEVPARLADVLLELSRDAGSPTFELLQTKRQLAAQLGTVAETLSRAFKKLKADGLIDVQGRRITILEADTLAELAEAS